MYKKIASNTISQILSKVLTAIISIFLIGILTKTLPVELYGSYNKVFSYLGIFAFLADLGLYTIAIREISHGNEKKEKIIGNVLTLRVGLGLSIWILACLIALLLPGYHDIYTFSAIVIIGAFTLISLVNSSLLALMQSQMKMEFSLFSVVFGKLINLTLVSYFLLVFFEKTPGSYLAFISVFFIATLSIFINTLLNYFYAQKICLIRMRYDREYIQHIFRISLPYGIALFLSVVYFKVDVILLSLLETPQQANISIALYGLPMKIVEVLMVLGGFYLNSILPVLSKNCKERNTKRIYSIFGISLKILGSLGILICLLGSLFKYELISIIATSDYIHPLMSRFTSVDVLSVVFFVLLFHFLALCCIYVLIAFEKQSLLLRINIFVSLVNIIGNIILIPYISFYGAAIVTLISQILLLGITAFQVGKIVQIPWIYVGELGKTMILAIVIFFSFSQYFEIYNFSPVFKILVFGTMIVFLYGLIEYMFSRKIIGELKH